MPFFSDSHISTSESDDWRSHVSMYTFPFLLHQILTDFTASIVISMTRIPLQREALKEAEALRRGGSARGNESKLHRQLRIVSGSATGKRLLSSQGAQTRPMMEKVQIVTYNTYPETIQYTLIVVVVVGLDGRYGFSGWS